MTPILDQMTVRRPQAFYRPTTARELFVLRDLQERTARAHAGQA